MEEGGGRREEDVERREEDYEGRKWEEGKKYYGEERR